MLNFKFIIAVFLFFNIHILFSQNVNLNEQIGQCVSLFEKLEAICMSDDGNLWGNNLYSPLLIVERNSRHFVSNKLLPFSQKFGKENVFIGFLPEKYIISNSVLNIETIPYTIVAYEESHLDTIQLIEICLHEMFHYWQETNKMYDRTYNNDHVATKWGKIYLILEIQALQKTLLSESFEERKESLKDALFFRGQRHLLFPEKIEDETIFELHEGLPEYTMMKLLLTNDSIMKKRLYLAANELLQQKTFVRNFGYLTGAIYAFLNDQSPTWRLDIKTITNLANLTMQIFDIEDIPLKLTDSILEQYNYRLILQREDSIQKMKLLYDEKIKNKFKKNKQIRIEFSNINIGFNPNEVYAIEKVGTYFPYFQISGDFGIIYTTEGALIMDEKEIILFCEKKTKIKKKSIQSENISLTLNNGYYLKRKNKIYVIYR